MAALPNNDSPDLHLVIGTPEENLAQLHVNSGEWKGTLSLDDYLRREEFLVDQDLTKDGGLTPWMLVHQPAGEPRKVLCGCESIKKKAIESKNGEVKDVVAHGIASVFCDPKHRGKGYAGRMMSELAKKLKTWQVEDGSQSSFSILYSDIGKSFYALHGWNPFSSAHVALPVKTSSSIDLPTARSLENEDLSALCDRDENLMRARLSKRKSNGTSVALVPDVRTLTWQHAREDFIANVNYKKTPIERGAIVGETEGSRVWCYWTRVWAGSSKDPNVLHILRMVVEDDNFSDFGPASESGVEAVRDTAVVKAIAAVLKSAQSAASEWDMHEVQLWNPTSASLAAAKLLDPKAEVEHREKESITSLQWYGEGAWKEVDWVMNEKYGWC